MTDPNKSRHTLVTIIADYGGLHDLAFAEVRERLYAELNDGSFLVETVAVPAFDTMATGFVTAQIGLNSPLGARHKLYVNTAPRKDDPNPRARNAGEGLAYAKLPNGVEIVAVNSGYSLSFVRDAAEMLRGLRVSAEGSQFRSRDVFPPAFARVARGDYADMGDDIRASVPDVPPARVCYTDGYGNMKTTLDRAALAPHQGQDVLVSVNGHTLRARVADGIFAVRDGEFCVSPGSSGWNGRPLTEIVCRGGNAAAAFGNPSGGAVIEWRPAS
ncbi:MAG: SAM-dependent chlorinase/fluorinase [Rhodospirillales bacterium]|nr:SAM-dependent chlorinase/fluorinase [Alphaproteobacteria bacterium]MCB9986389.1 SAM-dependent chlorinase/fluorinase [Rhodospirillales bacterium]USO07063.1 MAG: SAM-dependent chlorinase/fluorinase [Rhodospirillales bacterium]